MLDDTQALLDQSSKLKFIAGADDIIAFDQENNGNVYTAHTEVVGSGLPKKFLNNWKSQENEKMQKFLLCYFDENSKEITKMLSGEQYQESETLTSYTILNSYAKDKRGGNATQLIFDFVGHIEKSDTKNKKISTSLNLKLSQDCDLVNIKNAEEKKEALNELSIVAVTKEGPKFAETEDETIQKYIAEIKSAELWRNDNFKFFSSFLDAPELQPKLEIGSTSGNINLIATVPITKELHEYIEVMRKRISEKAGIRVNNSQRLAGEASLQH